MKTQPGGDKLDSTALLQHTLMLQCHGKVIPIPSKEGVNWLLQTFLQGCAYCTLLCGSPKAEA